MPSSYDPVLRLPFGDIDESPLGEDNGIFSHQKKPEVASRTLSVDKRRRLSWQPHMSPIGELPEPFSSNAPEMFMPCGRTSLHNGAAPEEVALSVVGLAAGEYQYSPESTSVILSNALPCLARSPHSGSSFDGALNYEHRSLGCTNQRACEASQASHSSQMQASLSQSRRFGSDAFVLAVPTPQTGRPPEQAPERDLKFLQIPNHSLYKFKRFAREVTAEARRENAHQDPWVRALNVHRTHDLLNETSSSSAHSASLASRLATQADGTLSHLTVFVRSNEALDANDAGAVALPVTQCAGECSTDEVGCCSVGIGKCNAVRLEVPLSHGPQPVAIRAPGGLRRPATHSQKKVSPLFTRSL